MNSDRSLLAIVSFEWLSRRFYFENFRIFSIRSRCIHTEAAPVYAACLYYMLVGVCCLLR